MYHNMKTYLLSKHMSDSLCHLCVNYLIRSQITGYHYQ